MKARLKCTGPPSVEQLACVRNLFQESRLALIGRTVGPAREEATLTPERYAALGAREQFVLAVSAGGFGKRSSSYEYRVTGRGGSGIVAIGMGKKNNAVIASFPVEDSDDLMLISDQGQTIRIAVSSVSTQGRSAGGVTIFKVDEGEKVVSVERIADVGGDAA